MENQDNFKKIFINFIWVVFVITISLVVLYFIFSYFQSKEPMSSIFADQLQEQVQEQAQEQAQEQIQEQIQVQEQVQDQAQEQVQEQVQEQEQVQLQMQLQEQIQEQIQVQEQVQEQEKIFKTSYNKFDLIDAPSSLKNPYIGRDYVCFRQLLGNQKYVQKRPHCMACQVDNKKNPQNYSGTNTNVIATCAYTDDDLVNPADPSLWNKKQCITACAEIKDMI